jgi:hypothetical protein
MNLRIALVLLVIGLELHAILALLRTPLPRRTRFKWLLLILALPFIGLPLWWRRTRNAPPTPVRVGPQP